MKIRGVVTLAFLLLSSSGSPPYNYALGQNFEFEWEAKSPGNALAFRLSKKTESDGLICVQGACLRATHYWLMIPVPMTYSGNLGILLEGPKGTWTLRSFNTELSLFTRAQKHMAQLRLPAQVVENIESNGDLIFADKEKDKQLYQIVTGRPWSVQWRWPIQSTVTSKFGSMRIPPHGAPYPHTGVDLRAAPNTIVRACSDGIILDEALDPILGNVLTIDHGKGLLSRYMHLSSFKAKVGAVVKAGDIIALSGSTGRSEAPHLHWEMRLRGQAIDPLETTLLLEHLAYLE